MAESDEPAALAYIEKTLADSYRKENVWRSLPFFAATLALQLAALFQMIDKLPEPGVLAGKISIGFLALAALFTLASLAFLAASIYPQRFDYVADEPVLFAYAQELSEAETAQAGQGQSNRFSALVTLKTELCRQYAKGAAHNRRINERLERRRSIAGLAALGSVLSTALLVGTTYTHYVVDHEARNAFHADAGAVGQPGVVGQGVDAGGAAGERGGAGSAADAGGH